MSALLVALPLVVDPEVTPDDGGSPGFLGFVFTFVLAVALILLALSLARQLRRVDRNAHADASQPTTEVEGGPAVGDEVGGDGTAGDGAGGDGTAGDGAGRDRTVGDDGSRA